jgi:hypothetical protein
VTNAFGSCRWRRAKFAALESGDLQHPWSVRGFRDADAITEILPAEESATGICEGAMPAGIPCRGWAFSGLASAIAPRVGCGSNLISRLIA